MAKDFRFGIGLRDAKSQSSIQEFARRVEGFGFDVLHVPDHLGMAAPFPTLTMAASATSTLRLGTFVLNAGFYKPALLARDVAALRDLSGGRFELGLGAGYVQEEFEAAELPYPTARQRIEHLQHVTEYMGEHVRERPDPDRGQRRPIADGRGAAGEHHRPDGRRPGSRRRRRSARRSNRLRPHGRR